jgi:Spy/CpxP family protein refolding chaperone
MKQVHFTNIEAPDTGCRQPFVQPMTIISVLLLLFFASSLSAQNTKEQDERQKRREEMKAKEAAFFTERIGLTAEEAQVFWPVYNELQTEKGALNKKMRDLHHNAKRNDKGERILDYEQLTEEMINIRVQEANLVKNYHAKFKKILSPEKLYRYYRAERDWGGELLKQIQKRGEKK